MTKKARVESAPVKKDSDDFEDFSDSDDGGVKLNDKKEDKPSIKGYQKTFEPGLYRD